jgi:hypothetical protein
MTKDDLTPLGLLAEAFGLGSSAVARCMAEGIDGQEAVSGTPHRKRLQDRIANIIACAELVAQHFGLDEAEMNAGSAARLQQLLEEHPKIGKPAPAEAAEPAEFDFG